MFTKTINKITCIALTVVITLGVLFLSVPCVNAESKMTTSDNGIAYIKLVEGFSAYPYWDCAQHTVGYGTRCPADKYNEYKTNGISEEDAQTLLRTFLDYTEQEINTKLIDKYNLILTQSQFDALVSFSFNIGTSWLTSSKNNAMRNVIVNGASDEELVYTFALYCHAGGKVLPSLVTRRLCEANMYLNNVYSTKQSDDLAYVYYDGNGGDVNYKVHGFIVGSESSVLKDATKANDTFVGWYTDPVGGECVNKLTKDLNEKTLFARWSSKSTSQNELIKVKVNGEYVNIRSGPGTNYEKRGFVNKGDILTISHVTYISDMMWGKFDKGWVALYYTNYDSVIKGSDKKDDNNAGEHQTEPTKPTETAKPTTTPTKPTEPSVEQPTKQPAPQDGNKDAESNKNNDKYDNVQTENSTIVEKSMTGTVKVNDSLRVRSGAGTDKKVVGYLGNGTKVSISETKDVGGMTWGKIGDDKWISLTYVKVDKNDDTQETEKSEDQNTANVIFGKVNVDDFLRIRSGPGTNNKIVGYLNRNDRVKITEKKLVNSMYWGKISNGWISLYYVIMEGENKPTNSTTSNRKIITADCLCIRSNAGTENNIVGYYYRNNEVEIIETKTAKDGTLWGKTSRGWISMQYAK